MRTHIQSGVNSNPLKESPPLHISDEAHSYPVPTTRVSINNVWFPPLFCCAGEVKLEMTMAPLVSPGVQGVGCLHVWRFLHPTTYASCLRRVCDNCSLRTPNTWCNVPALEASSSAMYKHPIKYISMYSPFSGFSDRLVILALELVSMYLTIFQC
jgi:hypothetical protein